MPSRGLLQSDSSVAKEMMCIVGQRVNAALVDDDVELLRAVYSDGQRQFDIGRA